MKNLNYKTVLKYLGATLIFFLADKIADGVPASLAYYTAFSLSILSPLPAAIIYTALNFLTKTIFDAVIRSVSTAFLCVTFCIYRSKKIRPKFELAAFLALSLLPYVFCGENGKITDKLVYSTVIAVLTFVLIPAFDLCFVKKFRRKGEPYEIAAFYISVVYTSLGAINVFGYKVWYDVALIALVFLCYFYKSPRAFIPAFILPVALALNAQSVEIISIFMIYCASVLIFAKTSRLLSALSLFVATVVICFLSGGFYVYDYSDYIFAFTPFVIFLFTPNAFYRLFQDRILKFDEPEITRELINVERGELSAKLYGISDVFARLEGTLSTIKPEETDDFPEKITDEAIESVCSECDNYAYCSASRKGVLSDIEKLVKTGLSKGKAGLADVPKNLSLVCLKPNDLLFEINRLLALSVERKSEAEKAEANKNLITMQAAGLSEALKELAYSFSDKIEFGRINEKILFDRLAVDGILSKQLIRAGKNYHLLFGKEKIDYREVAEKISELEGKKYRLFSKTDVGTGILTVFSPSPDFNASFGFATRTKSGSDMSGDNYCLRKINEGKFLVALCDGMGSGRKANENSLAVISIIENFFAAGLNREVILDITSGLIASCFNDGFSTLDSAVVDLYGGKCDVLKIGATFGFVIGRDGVRIIENNSLPLGVLEKVEPTVKSFTLCDGDSLVIISDGVSDAFFSSTDAVDFLTRENSANPQTFADKILEFALSLNGNVAKDDMTVLVVKIYDNLTEAAA